jgi:hypothetical protein
MIHMLEVCASKCIRHGGFADLQDLQGISLFGTDENKWRRL